MHVSIVICTYKRATLIRRTLESMRGLIIPPGVIWEIVVVINFADDTAAVLASFADRLPLTYVCEPTPGLSRSRNTGVAASSGDLLLFTDDDVLVDPDWMTAWLDAAERWPDATYFAGYIRPRFADDVPAWVRRDQARLDGMLCTRDLGPEPRALKPGEYPWGPNMAVRRRGFALASFDPRVGRIGKGQMRGSEAGFFQPLSRQGATGVWVPAAKVSHVIPRERATVRYLLRYYAGTGRSAAQLGHPALPSLRSQARLLRDSLQLLFRQPADWPRRLANVAWRAGRLLETRRLDTRAPRRPADRNPVERSS